MGQSFVCFQNEKKSSRGATEGVRNEDGEREGKHQSVCPGSEKLEVELRYVEVREARYRKVLLGAEEGHRLKKAACLWEWDGRLGDLCANYTAASPLAEPGTTSPRFHYYDTPGCHLSGGLDPIYRYWNS